MVSSYDEIKGYKWNEEHLSEISNSTIPSTLGVNLRTVQRIRKKLEDTWDADVTIKWAYKEEGAAMKVMYTNFVDKVMKMVEGDPTRSMKQKTIRDCISEKFKLQELQDAEGKRQKAHGVNKIAQTSSSTQRSPGCCGFSLIEINSVKIR
ncbi:Uncharacterized protein FKW44_006026, partial [Caligus rogercresseyi]